MNKIYLPNNYYHFVTTKSRIPNNNTAGHPYFIRIWNNALLNLNLVNVNECIYNYWMCSPIIMKQFIKWYTEICKPMLIKDPYIFKNSLYSSPNYKTDLIALWGKPYLPHYPFICERLNHSYFVTNHKMVFLISHDNNTNTGAPIALLELKKMYESKNIKTTLLFLPDIIQQNINIVDYINTTSKSLNVSPIVICNTTACCSVVKKLNNSNIITYWYIHEWFDDPTTPFPNNYSFLFSSKTKFIFICKKQFKIYKCAFPSIRDDSIIITNHLSTEKLDLQIQTIPTDKPVINEDEIVISIIGTYCPRKNQQKFIDNVFYRLVDKFDGKIKLMLVGDFHIQPHISEKYRHNIILVGCVSNPLFYINMSDIIVSYSINEVFPLNILESFYCKKPVVSSNVGGISEIIDHTVNGFLFDGNDSDTCYNYLNNLALDKDLRVSIGTNAYNKFLQNYDAINIPEDIFYILGFN